MKLLVYPAIEEEWLREVGPILSGVEVLNDA